MPGSCRTQRGSSSLAPVCILAQFSWAALGKPTRGLTTAGRGSVQPLGVLLQLRVLRSTENTGKSCYPTHSPSSWLTRATAAPCPLPIGTPSTQSFLMAKAECGRNHCVPGLRPSFGLVIRAGGQCLGVIPSAHNNQGVPQMLCKVRWGALRKHLREGRTPLAALQRGRG